MANKTGRPAAGRRRHGPSRVWLQRLLLLAGAPLLNACSTRVWPVIAPGAPVALAERNLLLLVAGLALVVVLPVFVLTFWVFRKFRAQEGEGPYKPHWTYSKRIDLAIWMGAGVVAAAIAGVIWVSTHRLDPYHRVASSAPPVEVQAIAEDWRWLFIYPKQDVAAVNRLVFPVGRPLILKITSDTVMNSLYIPGLAGQIYAMAGMQTRFEAIADKPGTFVGRNSQFSGKGFPDQHFLAEAVSAQQFERWLRHVKQSPRTLDAAAYAKLRKPSTNASVSYYSGVEPHLFRRVITGYDSAQAPFLAVGRDKHGGR